MGRFIPVTAALLAIMPTVAQAAEPPCLSPAEFTSLAEYALPSVISGTTQRCSPSLAPGAYLRRSSAQLVQRYAERKPTAWPGAKAAFLKLSSTTNADANRLIGTMPDATLQQMLDSLMEGLISQQIPVERCSTIDRVIGLLAPLPVANTAELIALAVGLGAKSGRAKVGAISICEA
jgi:DNA-binding transcriptional regulator YdaS (Cro superfamily)